jgi:general stress protein YciG
MAGTEAGGKAAAVTNKKKYGADFYTRIGAKGGQASNTGGFAANPELAREAGRKGGTLSSRLGVRSGDGKKRRVLTTEERLRRLVELERRYAAKQAELEAIKERREARLLQVKQQLIEREKRAAKTLQAAKAKQEQLDRELSRLRKTSDV